MDDLKFGQTVYTIERHCNNPNTRIVYGRQYSYSNKIMMRKVVNFDDKEVCLSPCVFVKREEIYTKRKDVEIKLKRKNEIELEAKLHMNKERKQSLEDIINKNNKGKKKKL